MMPLRQNITSPSRLLGLLSAIACSLTLSAAAQSSGEISPADATPVFKQYVEAQRTGAEPILADFSYAGYRHGNVAIPDVEGPVFDVTTFGAIADDDISDQSAIELTIAAAEQNGGGVVFFPPGLFLINTDDDAGRPIFIRKGNIVLRGSGYAAGGTVLKMVNHFEAEDPDKMYSTPFMIQVRPTAGIKEGKALAKVTSDARRETFAVTVDDASPFKAGDWVTLHLESLDAVPSFLAPFTPHEKFSRVMERGILVHERHSIERIDRNTLRFGEPLHVNVDAAHGWSITNYPTLEEFGVEDICFMGGWEQDFVHHRSALDDGGWSYLRIEQAVNSWVRRCTFINVNYSLTIRASSCFSVLNMKIAGNQGHHGIHTREGYGVLGAFLIDETNNHHGPSVGYRSSGTVYWRADMSPGQRIDAHSDMPIATLHDDVKGGVLYGSGGPFSGMPHHLRQFTLWNWEHRGAPNRHYDFWRDGEKECFVLPVVVGIHGDPVTFNEEHLELLESPGRKVAPASLYEAQLAHRLGGLPQWVIDAKAEADVMRAAELPPHPLIDQPR